jgi:mannose-6-phosphate isomerase-like protein (cupin superfamily)
MIIDQHKADAYDWGDGCKGYPLVSTQEQSIIYETMPPGTVEQYHYHKSAKQFFFILEGRARFNIEGEYFEVGPEQGIMIPNGQKHRIENIGESLLRFTVTSWPTTRGDRVNVSVSF